MRWCEREAGKEKGEVWGAVGVQTGAAATAAGLMAGQMTNELFIIKVVQMTRSKRLVCRFPGNIFRAVGAAALPPPPPSHLPQITSTAKKKSKMCPDHMRRARVKASSLLTCNLAAVELEAQGDAVLPGLRSDPHEANQDGLRDPVEHHLGGVGVGVENLRRRSETEETRETSSENLI